MRLPWTESLSCQDGWQQMMDSVSRRGPELMRRKPDMLVILALILGLGIIASGYTADQPDPEKVASQFIIR